MAGIPWINRNGRVLALRLEAGLGRQEPNSILQQLVDQRALLGLTDRCAAFLPEDLAVLEDQGTLSRVNSIDWLGQSG